jgi:hypothetical protein
MTLENEFAAGSPAKPNTLESVLIADVSASIQGVNEPGVGRRNFVRSVFAAVEGYLWSVQQELLDATKFKLSQAERGYLQDRETKLNSKGEAEEVPARTTLKQRVLLVAHLVKRVRPECVVDLGGEGWSDLMASLKLRDRLTHPKLKSDLDISDDEIRRAIKGLGFFVKTIVGTLRKGLADYRAANSMQLKVEALVNALRDYKSPNVPPPITPLKS